MPERKRKNLKKQALTLRRAASALLDWYDSHARDLPWRAGPAARAQGAIPDPYAVWLSEVMLQQTTVAAVSSRFRDFLARWPTIEALAAAPLDEVLSEWAGLGYYARARNLHNCARIVVARGAFPDTEEELRKLPGIGAYTAAAVAAIAFDKPAIVVDGNVERVMARWFAVETPLPAAKPKLREVAASLWPKTRSGDFAQALMDLGAAICTPRAPDCRACPISASCRAFGRGEVNAFPKRAAKKQRPTRYGAAFVVFSEHRKVIVERRPEKGLLGGMLGFPGTPWGEKVSDAMSYAPIAGNWVHTGKITHAFTHFHLHLDVYRTMAPPGIRRRADQKWISCKGARLPTVMQKVLTCATPGSGREFG